MVNRQLKAAVSSSKRKAIRRIAPLSGLIEQREALRTRVRELRDEKEASQQHLAEVRAELIASQAEARQLRQTLAPEQDLSYLFIVTYGRTGSTLLQGILCSIPGYRIRGENEGALHKLFRLHTELLIQRRRLARLGTLTPENAWYGVDGYPDQIALGEIRRLMIATVLRPVPGDRVAGFKEIRWVRRAKTETGDDLEEFIDFVAAVFPGARFIINTRNVQDVAKSKWWANRKDPIGDVSRADRRVRELSEKLGDSAFHVHYDDYVGDPAKLRSLFEWLGEEFDLQTVTGVLGRRHSS